MASAQSLSLETKTTLRLSTQQLRFVRLLEYNAPELEEAVDRELEENPALDIAENSTEQEESEERYVPLHIRRQSENAVSPVEYLSPASGESLTEALVRQLNERTMKPLVAETARFIIGNLDANGYLLRPLEGIVNDLAFNNGIEVEMKDAREALEIVRSLEPYGVGAYDLRECLLLQVKHLPYSKTKETAEKILEEQFDALAKKHIHKIISKLRVSRQEAGEAIDLIRGLNPKPGAAFTTPADLANPIIPDVAVYPEDGDVSISLPNNIPELVIDRSFSEAVMEMNMGAKKRRAKGSEFIVSRYNDARDFIKILRQRQETLMAVATAIVKIQKEYFLTQDLYKLRRMQIKDISAMTGLDFSVISRATNNKYLSTPWGVFPMRFFFSDSIGEEGENDAEVLTNRKIEAEIADIVGKEDKKHPLSDEGIKEEMNKRGYQVSRRTVAKYRDRKKIPVARLRREM